MTTNEIASLINNSPMNRGMDAVSWLETPGNRALASAVGDVLLFERVNETLMEFHWLRTVSAARGLIDWTLACADKLFQETACRIMYGLVPEYRRDSRMMARLIGAQFVGHHSGPSGLCQVFILTYDMRKRANQWAS